ncbi:MAG: DMT family transporter [Chakrabartia sp.]
MTSAPPSFFHPRVLIPFLVVTLIWGSTWFVIRSQIADVPASWSVTYRFLIAGLVMLATAAFNGQRVRFTWPELGFAAVIGVLQFAFNFNLVYAAEHRVTSGLVAVVFALLVIPNAVLARVFLGARFSGRFLFGSLLAMAGVGLLFLHEVQADPSSTAQTLLGVGLTIGGVMAASISNVMQASARARTFPVMSLLGWAMLAGTLVNAAWSWWTAGPPVFGHGLGYALGLGYLSIAASALTFTLYFGLIRDIGPAKAGFSSVLIPIIAMAISTFFEGYRWAPLTIFGGVVVLVGMVVALAPSSSGVARREA